MENPVSANGAIKILHVEDDEVLHLAILRFIEKRNLPYVVDRVATFAKAAGNAANAGYDVVLLDHLLPDGTGLELLGKFNGTPVIYLTGVSNINIAVEAMKNGACEYLIKDRDCGFLDLLPVAIEKVLGKVRLEREHKLAQEWIVRQNAELARLHEEAKALALHDPLTGLANRRLMSIELDAMVARAKRGGKPVAAIMLDIDHFKKFNDTHGHPAGDALLAQVAAIAAKEIREADLAARYGGEEFLALLPDSDQQEASAVAERIRRAVEENTPVTVSLGVAVSRGEMAEELIKRADSALYLAKNNGRNKVEPAAFQG